MARQILIETYDVIITSHTSSEDLLPEGNPVTLEAVTNPPGYEDDITWLSTTKYGTGTPVRGTGPTFTVQFDNTWAFDEAVGGDFQWRGVMADNIAFNQDQKGGCSKIIDLGLVTASSGLVVQGSTSGTSNSFGDCGFVPPCNRYDDGIGGPDQIYRYTVDTAGTWSMDTCSGADFDSSIQVREDTTGSGCPGDICLGQDDDCCGGVCGPEVAGTWHCPQQVNHIYFVIVDGYGPSDSGSFTLSISFLGTE